MQTQPTLRAHADAVVGAIIVGIVAIALAAVVSVTQVAQEDQVSTWPVDVRSTSTEPSVPSYVEFRAGERQMLPAEQKLLEERALIEFRQSERESR